VLSEVQSGAHVVAATGPAVGPAVVTGEVARKSAEPPSDAVPAEFIWRGRLYVVRDVLAHWRERRAWWRDALDAEEQDVRPGQTLAAAAREQHIWRVEASPGWSFAPGVYDLAHDESAGRDPSDRWSLVRVAD
jgi:predicted transcriptional regulator